jgi:hypothetical protein
MRQSPRAGHHGKNSPYFAWQEHRHRKHSGYRNTVLFLSKPNPPGRGMAKPGRTGRQTDDRSLGAGAQGTRHHARIAATHSLFRRSIGDNLAGCGLSREPEIPRAMAEDLSAGSTKNLTLF